MKKLLLSSIAASTLVLSTANAGMIIDAEVGVGLWNASPNGNMMYGNGGSNIDLESTLGLDSDKNGYIYADIDHFVPLIPNVRVEHTKLSTTGSKTLGNIKFGNNTFSSNTSSEVDLTHTDFIFYWGVPGLNTLSAGILDVRFGLDVKYFDGSASLKESASGTYEKVALDFFVPMGYVGATVDPPFIPASLSADVKYISYRSSNLYDASAKVSVNLPIPLPLIDFKLDVGYKEMSLNLDDSLTGDAEIDMDFSGFFAGISAKF